MSSEQELLARLEAAQASGSFDKVSQLPLPAIPGTLFQIAIMTGVLHSIFPEALLLRQELRRAWRAGQA